MKEHDYLQKKKVKTIEQAVIISDVGEIRLEPAKFIDRETIEVDKEHYYSDILPAIFRIRTKLLSRQFATRIILYLFLGKYITTRVHYIRFGEVFARDLHTNEYVDQNLKKRICDKFGRKAEDVSNVQYITEQISQSKKNDLIKHTIKAMTNKGITEWLPWIVAFLLGIGYPIFAIIFYIVLTQGG